MGVSAGTLFAQQATFRSVVDVIAVDVEVVDDGGNPIGTLGPQAFDVSIEGHHRKVVSASFIRNVPVSAPAAAQGDPVSAVTAAPAEGRTFILAIDSGSFEMGAARPAMDAARAFVEHLQPEDRIGLFVFPGGAWIDPSTQRALVKSTLDRIIGEKPTLRSHYNLRPSEIVDITAQTANPNSFLAGGGRSGPGSRPAPTVIAEFDPVLRVQRRECPDEPDCPMRIYNEGMQLAVQLEQTAEATLTGLDTLLRRLAEIPGRKAVVLVSGGMLVSDRLDGRPDSSGAIARGMGQSAARANATVYTVHIDLISQPASSASQRGMGSSETGRERAMFGNWLDQFSADAGGKRLYVPTGGGAFAFDLVLRESSAHYLLGVEPEKADRDGLPHKLRVKVAQRGLTVRSRQWVLIPVRGT